MADKKIINQVLELIPQQPPFRFIDEILAIDDKRISAAYRFREDEYFYKGHFPKNPVTPGVILIEAMAQTGVVAMGIYLLLRQGMSAGELRRMTTLFALVDSVEFLKMVKPGQRVIIKGEKVYLRHGNLKTRVAMEQENGESICSGVLTGTGIRSHEK
ncbi:MAG: beta-hydroxyacyl-ACP dehydratase [Deltaproteobacteria bacterium]|nr:beta-hydroxyacyl-ACP dehydratase [Deltaproteobacteria bacterium]